MARNEQIKILAALLLRKWHDVGNLHYHMLIMHHRANVSLASLISHQPGSSADWTSLNLYQKQKPTV